MEDENTDGVTPAPDLMPVHSARETQKLYPDCPLFVPMSMLNEKAAQSNHSQSLARLAERGGLDPSEILANIGLQRWRKMDMQQAINQLNKLLK